MSGISQTYLKHISCTSEAHFKNISGTSQAYLRHIAVISQAYFKHISGIFQAYLGHISGMISGYYQSYHQYILGHILDIPSPYFSKISFFRSLYLKYPYIMVSIYVGRCLGGPSKLVFSSSFPPILHSFISFLWCGAASTCGFFRPFCLSKKRIRTLLGKLGG